MTLVETCRSLDVSYDAYQSKQSCGRLDFLLRMSNAVTSDGNITPESIVRIQVLSQKISSMLPLVDEADREGLSFASKLLQTFYEVLSGVLSTNPEALGPILDSQQSVSTYEDIMSLLTEIKTFDSQFQLDTFCLEQPYCVMEQQNVFMLTFYDEDGCLQVFYPNREITSFQTLLDSSSLFITNLKVLKDLMALLLDIGTNGPNPEMQILYKKRYHALQQVMNHVNILDSLIIFKEDGKLSQKLPVKITKPRVVNEYLAKSSFLEPCTGIRCAAWVVG